MNKPIKIELEYWGHWKAPDSKDYKILKITGAVNVPLLRTLSAEKIGRVGDMISETEAEDLSSRFPVVTVPKKYE